MDHIRNNVVIIYRLLRLALVRTTALAAEVVAAAVSVQQCWGERGTQPRQGPRCRQPPHTQQCITGGVDYSPVTKDARDPQVGGVCDTGWVAPLGGWHQWAGGTSGWVVPLNGWHPGQGAAPAHQLVAPSPDR